MLSDHVIVSTAESSHSQHPFCIAANFDILSSIMHAVKQSIPHRYFGLHGTRKFEHNNLVNYTYRNDDPYLPGMVSACAERDAFFKYKIPHPTLFFPRVLNVNVAIIGVGKKFREFPVLPLERIMYGTSNRNPAGLGLPGSLHHPGYLPVQLTVVLSSRYISSTPRGEVLVLEYDIAAINADVHYLRSIDQGFAQASDGSKIFYHDIYETLLKEVQALYCKETKRYGVFIVRQAEFKRYAYNPNPRKLKVSEATTSYIDLSTQICWDAFNIQKWKFPWRIYFSRVFNAPRFSPDVLESSSLDNADALSFPIDPAYQTSSFYDNGVHQHVSAAKLEHAKSSMSEAEFENYVESRNMMYYDYCERIFSHSFGNLFFSCPANGEKKEDHYVTPCVIKWPIGIPKGKLHQWGHGFYEPPSEVLNIYKIYQKVLLSVGILKRDSTGNLYWGDIPDAVLNIILFEYCFADKWYEFEVAPEENKVCFKPLSDLTFTTGKSDRDEELKPGVYYPASVHYTWRDSEFQAEKKPFIYPKQKLVTHPLEKRFETTLLNHFKCCVCVPEM